MKKIIILFLLFSVFQIQTNGQDLIKDARTGILNPLKDALPNQIYQNVDQYKKSSSVFKTIDLFKISDYLNLENISTNVNDAVLINLKIEMLQGLLKDTPIAITLTLPITKDHKVVLDLIQVDPLAPGFSIQGSSGNIIARKDFSAIFYQGIVRGDPRSMVSISIFEDNVRGLIADDNGNYVLGPLKKNRTTNQYVLYNDEDLVQSNGISCGTKDDHSAPFNIEEKQNGIGPTDPCVGVYVECDFSFYDTEVNNSLQEAGEYVANLFTHTSTLFTNEQIFIKLSGIFVWEEEDPYVIIDTIENLLAAFRTEHNATSPRKFQMYYPGASLAHFLSSRSFPDASGIAYLPGLCSSSCYGVTSRLVNAIPDEFPTYSREVKVFTHELGHNFGSRHTHACVWNGNSTQIDDCGNTFIESPGSCYDENQPILPTEDAGGTIMSYCDGSDDLPGIKFINGFGTLPGAVIRNRYNNSNCLDLCGEDHCPTYLTLNMINPGVVLGPVLFSAEKHLTAFNRVGYSFSSGLVEYRAGEIIDLLPGFRTKPGANFVARILSCPPGFNPNVTDQSFVSDDINQESLNPEYLKIYPNPTSTNTTVEFSIEETSVVDITLVDVTGKVVHTLYSEEKLDGGIYKEIIEREKLHPGVYFIFLKIENNVPLIKKLIVN